MFLSDSYCTDLLSKEAFCNKKVTEYTFKYFRIIIYQKEDDPHCDSYDFPKIWPQPIVIVITVIPIRENCVTNIFKWNTFRQHQDTITSISNYFAIENSSVGTLNYTDVFKILIYWMSL